MEQDNNESNQLEEQATKTDDNGTVNGQAAENKDEGAVYNSFYVVLLDLKYAGKKTIL